MNRTVRIVALALVLVVGLAVAPAPALAFTQRSGNTVVVTRPITDDLYIQGANIEVVAPVDGDVVALGQNITITGNVTGDVIAAGQNISVRGSVGRSVRAAGSEVSVEGRVGNDVVAAGNNVRITGGGAGRDAVLAGAQVLVSGEVGRNVLASAQALTIAAPVGGNVRAEVQDMSVTSGGSVAGDLTYRSASEARIDGTVAGQTQRLAPRTTQRGRDQQRPDAAAVFVLALIGWVRSLVGLLLFGVLVMLALRGFADRAAEAAWRRPGMSLGIGFAILASAFPLAVLIFVFGLLIGGWWIAFVWLAVVWVLALVGIAIAALSLGGWILRAITHHASHSVPAVLLGVVALSVIGAIPLVGWLAYLLAMAWGAGAVVVAAYFRRDESLRV